MIKLLWKMFKNEKLTQAERILLLGVVFKDVKNNKEAKNTEVFGVVMDDVMESLDSKTLSVEAKDKALIMASSVKRSEKYTKMKKLSEKILNSKYINNDYYGSVVDSENHFYLYPKSIARQRKHMEYLLREVKYLINEKKYRVAFYKDSNTIFIYKKM